jgi:uncharacterized phage-associated protein
MSIKFQLQPQKSVQVAAMFLRLHKQPMHHLKLMKMLYMADRRSLEQIDITITGDRYVSMEFGPVLSNVYNLIKGEYTDAADQMLWSTYISQRKNHKINLLKDPGNSKLCEFEEDLIRDVYEDYKDYDRFDLAEETHNLFPEWQKPPEGIGSIPIRIETTLQAIGRTDEDIREIEETVNRYIYLDRVLHAH